LANAVQDFCVAGIVRAEQLTIVDRESISPEVKGTLYTLSTLLSGGGWVLDYSTWGLVTAKGTSSAGEM
jgi:hypothetical protein